MSHSENFQRLLDTIRDNHDRLVAVVVHLNDTYLIEERPDKLPGLARLIATVAHLREYVRRTIREDRVLVVHSGDFLGPSLLAKKDTGEAMVALLEKAGVRYCVLGNHEFDHKAEVLAQRVNRRTFKVLVANSEDPTGMVKVSKGDWWPPGTQDVAITGVVSETVHKSFVSPHIDDWTGDKTDTPWKFEPPNEALLRFFELSRQALFRIVLTHASQHEDRQLRRQVPAVPRTYVLGGHDHDIEWIENDRSVFVMKNLANCETVRVCLLLAGGESVVTDLVARDSELRRVRGVSATSHARVPQYPDDLEAVLLGASERDRAVITKRLEHRAREGGAIDDLLDALSRVNYQRDLLATTLRFDDHLDGAPADIAFVAQALAVTADPDDGMLIRDFTANTNGQPLEARDSHVRRQSTNFGAFVAECVRLHAGADVAILNSGSFRCDSLLSPKLHVRDLREAFLYDKSDGVIVLELDSESVDALLEHGLSRAGSGGFPQFADRRTGSGVQVKVAISSYLLTRADSIDGYDGALKEQRGLPDARHAREFVSKAAKGNPTFGIIEAVKKHAAAAAFSNPPSSAEARSTVLIGLLKDYSDAFFNEVQKEGAPLKKNFPTEMERTRIFRDWLGSDVTIPASRSIAVARDAVRSFLRALPAVAAYQAKAGASWIDAWSAARKELLMVQSELAGHDFVFRDRADYGWLFDLAARGLPGWRSRPDG